MINKIIFQKIKDFILFPFVVLISENQAKKLGLETLKEKRIKEVLKCCRGKVLDIGCGHNELIKKYKNGIGVDAYHFSGVDIVCDAAKLPFENQSFDTITFVASLNHIINREDALKEANRVLKNDGRVIITMLGPFIGFFCHKLSWHDEYKMRSKGKELNGMSKKEITNLLDKTGFKIIKHITFEYGLNHLYVAIKK